MKAKAIAPPAREMRSPFVKPRYEVIVMIGQEDFDNSALAELEFEEYVDELAQETAPEIEIDSVPDELGELDRVWHRIQLIGTFYQNLEGK